MLLYVLALRPTHVKVPLHAGFLVGNDVRKAAADGFPVEQIIASDLKRGETILPVGPSLVSDTQLTDHVQNSGTSVTYSSAPVRSHFQ